MIRGVGNEVMDSKTEYIGLEFYKPRDQKYGNLPCSDLRIVQYGSYPERLDTRLSWSFPNIELRLEGRVPDNIDTIAINLHWRDADMMKAAYSLNKDENMVVSIYFGNMSQNDRKNRMIVNTVTFSPKISLPRAKNAKFLHLRVNETVPFSGISSLITVNKHWGPFWNEDWLNERP